MLFSRVRYASYPPMRRLSFVCTLVLAPWTAMAAVPPAADAPTLTVPLPTTQIYGGVETEQCAWPSVVYLSTNDGACTGTLIHPQIVLTAAHCVPDDVTATVRFGERSQTAVQLADTEFCRANPGFNDTGGGDDYGFCKLATPVDNIPVTPIAYGCEESILGVGTHVTHVGYGNDEEGVSGRKKFVSLDVDAVTSNGELITGGGGSGEGICSGDSGGPVMTRLSASLGGDDTWRVVGIHSWAEMSSPGECNGVAGSVIASRAVGFIEQESGIDITPCFTAGGNWDPTWGCQEFPIDPAQGGDGSYNLMCETGPLGGFSSVCGNPLTDYPDTDPPSLEVLSPQGNQEFEVDGGDQAELHIEANADDGDGWGLAQVELVIVPEDGEMASEVLTFAPFRWNTVFPAGGYNLKLIATDNAGLQTDSGWIAVGVGTKAPENPPGGDTGAADDTGAQDTGDSAGDAGDQGATSNDDGDASDEADDDDEDSDDDGADGSTGAAQDGATPAGCGCRSTTPADGGVALLTFAAVVGLGRRRRARGCTSSN